MNVSVTSSLDLGCLTFNIPSNGLLYESASRLNLHVLRIQQLMVRRNNQECSQRITYSKRRAQCRTTPSDLLPQTMPPC
jgi:hypothetical protein